MTSHILEERVLKALQEKEWLNYDDLAELAWKGARQPETAYHIICNTIHKLRKDGHQIERQSVYKLR